MRIGLLGFEFDSPNKGCEALSYAFMGVLSDILKKERVVIEYISNCSLGKIPEVFPQFLYVRTPARMKDPLFNVFRAMHRCDYIFDVTMGDSFSDIYSEQYCLSIMRYKRAAEILCRKYILLPQTYGPFTNSFVRKRAKKIIQKAYSVYSRDRKSEQYLSEIGISRKIDLTTDMAFIIPYDKSKYFIKKDKFNLGINVSGLLWKGGFQKSNQFDLTINYKEYIRMLLNFYSDKETVNIHLIPHVIDLADNPYDDDYQVIKELYAEYPDAILAPAFDTPIEAKSYIAQMDCFVGSRMHSTIAAFSSGVATIPVSYSRKFEGLFEAMDYDFLIHGTEDSTVFAFEKTIQYVANYKELKSIVEQKTETIVKDFSIFIHDIEKLLNKTE